MKIIQLRNVQKKQATIEVCSNDVFLKKAVGGFKTHHLSRTGITTPTLPAWQYEDQFGQHRKSEAPAPTVSLLIQGIHNAFDTHTPLCLKPEVFWYAIVHEVAICVKQNSKKYAKYFTDSEGKKELHVRDDSLAYGGQNDWARAVGLFKKPLIENISSEMTGLLLPQFSTMTPEIETAILVTFMDVVSDYYKYHVHSMCGIPEIRLEGSKEDWQLLYSSVKELSSHFPDLAGYFTDLQRVLRSILESIDRSYVDQAFWSSIYKVDHNSGGPYINGWITAFTAYLPKGEKGFEMKAEFDWYSTHGCGSHRTNDFPTHISKVPFTWHYLDQKIKMALIAGVMGVEHLDGQYLAPSLGFGVVEPDPCS